MERRFHLHVSRHSQSSKFVKHIVRVVCEDYIERELYVC